VVEAVRAASIDLLRTLHGLGYADCAVAASAEQAMPMAVSQPPDLVFIDIRLNREDDGFETAARLREAHEAAFIFISARSGEADLRHALDGSRFQYAVSPLEPEQVRQAISDTLSVPRRPGLTRVELGLLLIHDPLTGLGNPHELQRDLQPGPAFAAPSITASVGVSVTQPSADTDPQELRQKAERALAAAQTSGATMSSPPASRAEPSSPPQFGGRTKHPDGTGEGSLTRKDK